MTDNTNTSSISIQKQEKSEGIIESMIDPDFHCFKERVK